MNTSIDVFCLKKVEISSNGVAVAYCVLLKNHEGRCKIDERIAKAYDYENPK